jgi:anti-sigma B factor antagonist
MGRAEADGRLSLDYHLDSDVAVVTVTGELDIATSGLLREGLLRVLTDEHRRGLVVNLSGASFLDSTGTGVLVGILHRVRALDLRLAVAAPSPPARRILEIAGLEKVLSVFDTESEAVEACRVSAGGQDAS